jgi:hypothetical protein
MATVTKSGLTPEAYDAFRVAVLNRESGGNYQIVGPSGSYIGGYQMGSQALETIGYLKPGSYAAYGNKAIYNENAWTGKSGVRSSQDFLSNATVQDQAFRETTEFNAKVLSTVRTPTGTTILTNDVDQATRAGYLGAAHQNGAGSVISQGLGAKDGNGQTGAQAFVNAKTAVSKAAGQPVDTGTSTTGGAGLPAGGINFGNVNRNAAVAESQLTTGYSSISVSSVLTPPPSSITLPIPNPLEKFTSFNSLFTLSSLSPEEINFPETSYRAAGGSIGKIILSSGGRDPNNRASTAYITDTNPSGKYDFFIDNVEFDSVIAPLMSTKGTNTNLISFDVYEPYSMGQFLQACQIASFENGHIDYTVAPFLLTIEFVGYTENNKQVKLDNYIRYIPIQMHKVEMNITASGCKYSVRGNAWNEVTLADDTNLLKQDTAISGTTVAEVLQTGEHSLEVAINSRLQKIAEGKDGKPAYLPNEIAIIFPKDIGTSQTSPTDDDKATPASQEPSASATSVEGKLLLTRNSITKTFAQESASLNAIGLAAMNFDESSGGNSPKSKDNEIEIKGSGGKFQRNLVVNPANNREFSFRQGTTIINAITEVVLMSKYCTEALTVTKDAGMYDWFRIETHCYLMKPDAGNATANLTPKLMVFRVVPYQVQSSKFKAPGITPKGYKELLTETVKHYNYIYTGQNVDVLDFKIQLNNAFATTMFADGLGKGEGTAAQTASGRGGMTSNDAAPLGPDNTPSAAGATAGEIASGKSQLGVRLDKYKNSDGVATNDYKTLVAKAFHQAVLNSDTEKVVADLTILGDPYYIADSGLGNFTNTNSTDKMNLTATNAMDYQSSEVDILFNFRTPIDLNKNGGMTFASDIEDKLEVPFSGLYQVIRVKNQFQKGKFIQVLQLARRPQQTPVDNSIFAELKAANSGQAQPQGPTAPTKAAASTPNDADDYDVAEGEDRTAFIEYAKSLGDFPG